MNHTDSTDSERKRTYHLMLFNELFSYLLLDMAIVLAIVMLVSGNK